MIQCREMFKPLLKVVFFLSLLTTFLTFFGIPAIVEFLNKDVIIRVSEDASTDGTVPAPAGTICTENPETGAGWKTEANVSYFKGKGFKDGYAGCRGSPV